MCANIQWVGRHGAITRGPNIAARRACVVSTRIAMYVATTRASCCARHIALAIALWVATRVAFAAVVATRFVYRARGVAHLV